ncbi:MAG: tyrosine-type recombinase/integrase [Anaerolineales bacterium]|jgi:integrase
MKFVEPIRDRKKITQIKNQLRGQNRYRDLLLFVVGINTALRISDLLELRPNQFIGEDGEFQNRFWIKEQKRGKRHEIAVNQSIQEALTEYLEAYPFVLKDLQSYLFFNPRTNKHIKRGQAWKFITTICQDVGLRGNYGTHSLRKTWGYHARMQGVDLALIMYKLNHNSIAYTKRYLGITDDELQAIAQRLNL